MFEPDRAPCQRITHEILAAMKAIGEIEVLEVAEGEQVVRSIPEDYDPFGFKQQFPALIAGPPGQLPWEAPVRDMITRLAGILKGRNIQQHVTRPMWFAKLDDMGYLPFRYDGYLMTIGVECKSLEPGSQATLGIYVTVREDFLE